MQNAEARSTAATLPPPELLQKPLMASCCSNHSTRQMPGQNVKVKTLQVAAAAAAAAAWRQGD